jgi:uncharacterized protein (DUF2237 family)
VPLMLHIVCCAITGELVLYYRSLGTAPTLLRRDNISGRPCRRVMTYKALDFFALKQLGNYCKFYTISFENPKTCQVLQHIVCCAMAGELVLYYRSLGTSPTLLRRDNISGRPRMRVMTYKALDFFALKQLGNYCKFYTISFENPKTCQMVY